MNRLNYEVFNLDAHKKTINVELSDFVEEKEETDYSRKLGTIGQIGVSGKASIVMATNKDEVDCARTAAKEKTYAMKKMEPE